MNDQFLANCIDLKAAASRQDHRTPNQLRTACIDVGAGEILAGLLHFAAAGRTVRRHQEGLAIAPDDAGYNLGLSLARLLQDCAQKALRNPLIPIFWPFALGLALHTDDFWNHISGTLEGDSITDAQP